MDRTVKSSQGDNEHAANLQRRIAHGPLLGWVNAAKVEEGSVRLEITAELSALLSCR